MCSGSEAGSYLRLIDFVYHSTLGLRVIKKKKSFDRGEFLEVGRGEVGGHRYLTLIISLLSMLFTYM